MNKKICNFDSHKEGKNKVLQKCSIFSFFIQSLTTFTPHTQILGENSQKYMIYGQNKNIYKIKGNNQLFRDKHLPQSPSGIQRGKISL